MPEPTNRQLANFACIFLKRTGVENFDPAIVEGMLDSSPILRGIWLKRHTEFQKRINELDEELKER